LLRAESGFAREALMAWCENSGVDFLFGLAKNARLSAEIETELAAAQEQSQRTGRSARRFKDFTWRTRKSWSRERRVVAKGEWTGGEANPRFVVTSLAREEHQARHLYEKLYCARGEMESRIKECQLDLYADRTSAHSMRANQLRLWFASMAYVLICALRRIGLKHTHAPHQAGHAFGLSASGRIPRRLCRADRHHDSLTNQKRPAKNNPRKHLTDHCTRSDSQKLKPMVSTHNRNSRTRSVVRGPATARKPEPV